MPASVRIHLRQPPCIENFYTMKTKYQSVLLIVVAGSLLFGGCSSTAKRAGIIGGAGAAGALAGAAVAGEKNRLGGAIIGGTAVAGITALALGKDQTVYIEGLDDGYSLGSSDAIKRHYWAKQALESPEAKGERGRMSYYVWEESGIATDGRRLAPERVAVPVYEPID